MSVTSMAARSVAAAAGPRPSTVGGVLARLVAWWDERRRIARTVAELDQLSDAELQDIGITRADIPRVARGAGRGEA